MHQATPGTILAQDVGPVPKAEMLPMPHPMPMEQLQIIGVAWSQHYQHSQHSPTVFTEPIKHRL